MGVGALLIVAFAGAMAIAEGIQRPKVELPVCLVPQATIELIQGCPADSRVVSQGKEVGTWTGVILEK